MARFECPACGREVVADADLEGHSAPCARCGARVRQWPPPVRRTKKPRSRLLDAASGFFLYALFAVLVLVVLAAVFSRR